MTKDEALKIAIESLEQLKIFLNDELETALYCGKFYNIETAKIKLACCENKLQVCAEALEQLKEPQYVYVSQGNDGKPDLSFIDHQESIGKIKLESDDEQ